MIQKVLKRGIDIIGSFTGLLLLTPLLPFIALGIKMESPGPIFVKLERVSNGKKINLYKFRSMIYAAHILKPRLTSLNERTDGPFFKMKSDPRLTHMGKALRKVRLDEFPQLLNVLKGDLSLVGPRPHEPVEVVCYPDQYKHLLLEKAGVTGLSQINGASSLPFLKELQLDSDYVKKQNLWLDAKIIGKTITILFFDPTAI